MIGPDGLQAWRRPLPKGWQRAVSSPRKKLRPHADRVGEDTAVLEAEPLRKAAPEEAYGQVLDRMRRQAFRSREDFQAAVRQLRKWNPQLIAHMTDEQAARTLEEQWRRQLEESVQRVYRQRGRDRELQIRIP